MMHDAYARIAKLPLVVEGYGLEGLRCEVSSAFVRHTTAVYLYGEGLEGVGEDVTWDAGDQQRFRHAGPVAPLTGHFTVGGFAARVGELDLFPEPPRDPVHRRYRRWAFESAALDLALRQSHRSLAAHLGLEPAPVRFVVSTGLGDPPSAEPLRRWREIDPGLRFKLDAKRSWSDALIDELAGGGAVDTVDFKGAYRPEILDRPADPDLYGRVARAFPRAWLEDPALTPATEAALAGHMDRVAWDAPLHSAADVAGLRHEPRMINVKPSRFGSLATLFEVYGYCAEHEIGMYGGGQFELGPGRGQIQYLAALFHPDAPNDVAPGGYNEPRARPGLPASPLVPRLEREGFRWAG